MNEYQCYKCARIPTSDHPICMRCYNILKAENKRLRTALEEIYKAENKWLRTAFVPEDS